MKILSNLSSPRRGVSSPINAALLFIPFLTAGSTFAQYNGGQPRSVEDWYAAAQSAEAHNDLPTAIHDYQQILKIAPGTVAAYNNLGTIYYDSGDYQKAIEVLRAGLRINPNMATAYAVLGSAYLALGNHKDAISEFSLALKQNPDDKRTEDVLEQTLIAESEYAKAAERLRNRLAHAPDDQDAWYRLGKVYLQESQEAFDRVNKINPESAVAHELHGELEEDLGHLQQAQQQYELAVKQSPEKPGTHEHLGNVYWLQALWVPAEQEFKAELKNDEGSCRVHWKLANCLLNQGENAEDALKETDIAVKQCPQLMQARVDRARALISLGRSADALDDLLLAEKSDPSESNIHFLLSKVYQAKGDTVRADAEKKLFSQLVDHGEQGSGGKVAPQQR